MNYYEMLKLVGCHVRVTLVRKPLMQQVGVLSAIDPFGECVIIDDHGVKHYCWPALEIELEEYLAP